MADSPDQDFRNETYAATQVKYDDVSEILVKIDYPVTGFRAFYIELVYPDPVEGQYSKTTRMFVADTTDLFLD
jgi:PhoPQ-activated pathogenicity-related protein